jgi:hypothetical protein
MTDPVRRQLDTYRDLLVETRDFFKGKFKRGAESRDLIDRISAELERDDVDRQYREAKLP